MQDVYTLTRFFPPSRAGTMKAGRSIIEMKNRTAVLFTVLLVCVFGMARPAFAADVAPPTMEPIAEPEDQYYRVAPVFSNFGFDDDVQLDDGWYQIDSFAGAWEPLFTDIATSSWDNDGWGLPGFGSLSEGSHTVYFRASDNSTNQEGESGEWSWVFIKDTIAPAGPTNVASSSHIVSVWSGDKTVDITWTAATDGGSGLDGYSFVWDNSPATVPDVVKDIEEGIGATTSPALADGSTHYFHIRAVDNAGNWQTPVHLGPFFIDTGLPSMEPIVEPQNQYYSTAPTFSIFGFDDNVALDDGWYQVDSFSGNWTAIFTNATGTSWDNNGWVLPVFGSLSEGSHTVYFKASDDIGNLQGNNGEVSWQFIKDTTAPGGPADLDSPSHTLGVWSGDRTIDVTWTAATDNASGLDGYSYVWDTSPATFPDTTKDIEETATSLTSATLAESNSHYLHIRAVDNAGNWQAPVHLGPFFIDTLPPGMVSSIGSPSPRGTAVAAARAQWLPFRRRASSG